MNERIKKLLKSKNRAAEKIQSEKSDWSRYTKIIFTALMLIGVVSSIIIAVCVSEYYETFRDPEITVNILGLVFDIDAETNVLHLRLWSFCM